MIKVRYTGDYYKVSLKKGKIYDAQVIAGGLYAIVDETDEEYVFGPDNFDVVEE